MNAAPLGLLLLLLIGAPVLASLVALWSWGRFARRARGAASAALPLGRSAPLDRLLGADPGSALLLFGAEEALGVRIASAQLAARSLDIMTYIWAEDRSGWLVARAALDAADRGVRVRILIDDVNILGRDPTWLALDRHPGVELRVFNPVPQRRSALMRGLQMALLALRYNRRMHGKLWLADGRLAITGGRNIGDVYFGAARGRKREMEDADLLFAGPRVAEAEGLFDRFWNSEQVIPLAALWGGRLTRRPYLRRRQRGELPMPSLAEAHKALAALLARRILDPTMELVADGPEKAANRGREGWLPQRLLPMMGGAQTSLRIATPYLVPGRRGLQDLQAMAARGLAIGVVTNTLAVIDHAFVYGGWRWYLRRLAPSGLVFHEFIAAPEAAPVSDRGPQRMLHAKMALVDGRMGFVGSFNFDLRSSWLNTEMGMIFTAPELVAGLAARFDWLEAPAQSYRLELDAGRITWRRGGARHLREPKATRARRLVAALSGHLPVHWLL